MTLSRYLVGGLGLIAAIAIGAWLWERGEVTSAIAARDAAYARVSALEEANRANQLALKTLIAEREINEALVASYSAQVDALRQQARDAASAIRKLSSENAVVKSYLDSPLPPDLRRVLNHTEGAAAGPN